MPRLLGLLIGLFGFFSLLGNPPHILNQIEADMASFRLAAVEKRLPGLSSDGYRAYYQFNLLYYKFLATQSPFWGASLDDQWESQRIRIEALPETDPLRGVMLAELYLKHATFAFINDEYWTALRDARKSRRLIMENARDFPGNKDQLKVLGIFNVTLGSVPRRYAWLATLLGFRGDLEEGEKQLRMAAKETGLLMGHEVHIVLSYLEKNLFDQADAALTRLQDLREREGANILTDFLLASSYLNFKQNDAALRVLAQGRRYRQDSSVFYIPYWDFLTGKAYYFKDQQEPAQKHFLQFLRHYEGRSFRADALFRMGMSLSLDDHYDQGQRFFKLVANLEEEIFEEDAYARFLAGRFFKRPPSEIELALFRARNRFDGGYLSAAEQHLMQLQSSGKNLNSEQTTELHYRYGRIYHSSGQLEKAQNHYQLSIDQPPSPQTWMQAYAHFYLGQLAMAAGENDRAAAHFKAVFSDYDDYFYQQGLENRCKAALRELKKG